MFQSKICICECVSVHECNTYTSMIVLHIFSYVSYSDVLVCLLYVYVFVVYMMCLYVVACVYVRVTCNE